MTQESQHNTSTGATVSQSTPFLPWHCACTPRTSANGIPAFAFPAEAGTHLPTPEGWKAEFSTGNTAGRNYRCEYDPSMVTHLASNPTWRRLPSFAWQMLTQAPH